MNGCEKSDEMLSYYNFFESKSLKWWKRFFSNLFLKVTKTNAYILYALSHVEGTTKVSPRKFKKTLIDKLTDYLTDMFF